MTVDFHTHIYQPEVWKKIINRLESYYDVKAKHEATADSLLKSLKEASMDYAVTLPVATRPEHVASNNAYFSRLARQHPQLIHPEIEPEVLNNFPLLGFKGFKVQANAWQIFPADPSLLPYYRKAQDLNLIVVFHAGDEEGGIEGKYTRPQFFLPILEQFPSLKCVFAHLGGYKRWDEAEALYSYSNAYFDTSYTLGILPDDEFVEITKRLRGRVVFGTDFPFRSLHEEKEQTIELVGIKAFNEMGNTATRLLNLK